MKWARYLLGSALAFLVIGTVTVMVSGFILLDTWGSMEKNGVLKPAQGGNTYILVSYSLLLLSTFLLTFIYIRLKKADSPLLIGPIAGALFSMSTVSGYFFYMIPSIKVPLYITLQNMLGFTLGLWIFRKTYYK